MTININFEENSAALKISKDIYLRILAKAIEQTEKDLPELEGWLAEGQFDKVQTLSHRLKGDFGNLRIMLLSDVAKQLNELSKTTKDKTQAGQLFNAFKDSFQQLKQLYQEAMKK